MAKPPRVFDEELGKRDDDHKLRIKPNRKMAWYNPKASLRRLRRKRMAVGVAVLICLYLFIKFLPEGVDRQSNRPIYTHPPGSNGRPPPRMGDVTEVRAATCIVRRIPPMKATCEGEGTEGSHKCRGTILVRWNNTFRGTKILFDGNGETRRQ